MRCWYCTTTDHETASCIYYSGSDIPAVSTDLFEAAKAEFLTSQIKDAERIIGDMSEEGYAGKTYPNHSWAWPSTRGHNDGVVSVGGYFLQKCDACGDKLNDDNRYMTCRRFGLGPNQAIMSKHGQHWDDLGNECAE